MKELKIFLTVLCTLCIFPVKAQSPEKVEEKFPIVCVDPSGRVEYVTAEAWDSVATARPDLRAEGILVVPEKNLFPRVSPFVVGDVSRREYEWNDVNDHYLPDLEQGKAINRYRKEIDKGLKALRQEQVGFKKIWTSTPARNIDRMYLTNGFTLDRESKAHTINVISLAQLVE